jgi:hypothetical protein
VANATVTVGDETYTGKELTPAVKVNLNSAELVQDTDYTVTYSDNTKAGKATVSVAGKGIYTGTVTATFNIKAASISAAKIATIKDQTYTGKAIKPTVKVTLDGKTLKSGTDYTVSYKNNTAIGAATVSVKAKGNYSGTKTAKFNIASKAATVTTAAKFKKVVPEKAAVTTKVAKKAFTIKIKAVKGATKYTVRYKVKGTSKWKTKTLTVKQAKNGLKLTKLKKGKTYVVQYKVTKKFNKKAATTKYSKTITTKKIK